MDKILTPEFWQHQWAVVMAAPWLIIPLLVIAGYLGWRFKGSVDDGELRGFRAQKDAANDRLQLAHERYEGVVGEIGTLRAKVSEQAKAVEDLKNHPAMQQYANQAFNRLMQDRLDRLFSSNNEISNAVTNLATSTDGLGTTLTISPGKYKTSGS